MKTLLINAHPDYLNPAHFSLKLQTLFLKKFAEEFPHETATVLNLYEAQIPRITPGELQTIWTKQAEGLPLADQEKVVAQTSQNLLAQFKNHQRIVIVSPLHNFNITSALKDYLDNILIARETFRYLDAPDENGKVSVGLMKNNYKMLLLFASGSLYTENTIYRTLDFAPNYLKSMFQEIMGFDQVAIVRAEGTAVLPEETILSKASLELTNAFQSFYR